MSRFKAIRQGLLEAIAHAKGELPEAQVHFLTTEIDPAKLLNALDRAQVVNPPPVQMSQPVRDMTAEEVREIFGGDAPTRRGFPFKP